MFDLDTYNQTGGLRGRGLVTFVHQHEATIHLETDADGKPTKSGAIAYLAAYALLAAFVGYLFIAL